ncbi:MAG: DUF4242 domain-containing protein [Chloroflexota bacterium]|nr:MAG: DUF4242 domain-containing protein [Chloroflexota bacterium]
MSRFIDYHTELKLPQEAIQQLADEAKSGKRDQYGVRVLDVYYNPQGKVYCYLDGPSEEAIRQHHLASGVTCDEVTQVDCLSCA